MVLPSLIIIGGVCGSGKTTVGKELAARIGYQFFDADDFHSAENKAKMGKGYPLTVPDAERMPWLEQVANIWRNNPGGKHVIACSALKQHYRSLLLGDKQSKREGVIVILDVPEEVLMERTTNRTGHYAMSNLIKSQLETLELPRGNVDEPFPTKTIIIDGSLTVTEVMDEILRKINF